MYLFWPVFSSHSLHGMGRLTTQLVFKIWLLIFCFLIIDIVLISYPWIILVSAIHDPVHSDSTEPIKNLKDGLTGKIISCANLIKSRIQLGIRKLSILFICPGQNERSNKIWVFSKEVSLHISVTRRPEIGSHITKDKQSKNPFKSNNL